jgi:hypothetical protein
MLKRLLDILAQGREMAEQRLSTSEQDLQDMEQCIVLLEQQGLMPAQRLEIMEQYL